MELTQPLGLGSKLLVLTQKISKGMQFLLSELLNVPKYIMKVLMSFPITPYLCRSKLLKYVFFNRHKTGLPDFRPKCSPSKENQSQAMIPCP